MRQSWRTTGWIVDVECVRNHMAGTDVRVTLLDVDLKPFTFDDWNIDAQGFDGIKSRIEDEIAEQVESALRLSDGD